METSRRNARPLTRRDWYLLLGVGVASPLALAVIVGMPLLYLQWTCSDYASAFPSPDGEIVALRVSRSCGGAAGSVTSSVRVRRINEPDAAAETILNAGIGLDTSLTWIDNCTLVIDYPIQPERQQYVGTVTQPTNGVTVLDRPRTP